MCSTVLSYDVASMCNITKSLKAIEKHTCGLCICVRHGDRSLQCSQASCPPHIYSTSSHNTPSLICPLLLSRQLKQYGKWPLDRCHDRRSVDRCAECGKLQFYLTACIGTTLLLFTPGCEAHSCIIWSRQIADDEVRRFKPY